MAQVSVELLQARYKKAQGVSEQWRSLLNDVYDYAMPQRNTMYRRTQGEYKSQKIYDSTAIKSTVAFANRIQSDMMPPFQRWVNLTVGNDIPEELEDQAREILDEISDKLYATISQSNFDSAVNEMLLDLASGTGAMLIQGGTDRMPVSFTSIPISQISIEEGAHGTVEGVYRTHKLKVRHIMQTWRDAKMPESLVKMMQQQKRDPEVELVECSYYDAEEDIWRYEIMYMKDKARLVERTSLEPPIIVPRWTKVAGEVFGRGPLVQALPDIKTLNALTKMVLQNASLAIAGAYMVADDGVVNPNTLVISPGTFIPVSRTAGPNGPAIAPIPRSGDFNVAELERDKLVTSIKQCLFDEALPPQAGAVRSATEIVERVKELSRSIGAPFGRLMSEFVTPMVRRTLEVMEKAEIIAEHIEVDGKSVEIGVTSPLAQEQNLADVDRVVRWLEIMLGTVGQEVLMMGASVEDIPEYLAEKLGVPVELIRNKADREMMQQAAAQQMQAAQQGQPPQGG